MTKLLGAQCIGRGFTLTHLLFQQDQHDTMKELEALKKERSGYQVYVSHNSRVMLVYNTYFLSHVHAIALFA